MLSKKQFYINGKWVDPTNQNDFEVINPSNEEVCAIISLGNLEDTNSAVKAARNSFVTWWSTPKDEKLNILNNLLAIYKKRFNEMAEAISIEMGAPIDWATKAQSQTGEDHIINFINAYKDFKFEKYYNEETGNYISYEPIGVCGLITPWNWPINQIALKVIPALSVGCTVILKPSEIAPLSGMLFAEMIDEAGFPPGVFNLVNGDGTGVGSQLSSHPDVDMISFTGSTRAGKLITKNAADTIKRVCLELGGKGANIVFADADADAIKRGVTRVFRNTGQSCNAPTRLLVEKSLYNEAIIKAVETAKETKVDIAEKQGGHIGPVVSKTQYDKIQNLIKIGIEEGAKLETGGLDRPDHLHKGYFIRPTVFSNVTNDMTIAKEEIFGPVISIMSFSSEEEAIEIANETSYGLTNYLQTQDRDRAHRIAKQLRSGMVEINGEAFAPGSPFGGYKQSGNGREGGPWGLEEFLEVKSISGWK
tara:strand:- start:4025 stop:5455 length:1431 start_codon:yes stop_codon:yes gene_type:complete